MVVHAFLRLAAATMPIAAALPASAQSFEPPAHQMPPPPLLYGVNGELAEHRKRETLLAGLKPQRKPWLATIEGRIPKTVTAPTGRPATDALIGGN